ncbi:MAG: hypothetical protein J7L26_04180 [Candidatus Aminicenantes bacterium]|nr:hypothetical protein [Candidatus Aminicenantes bacterium]
MRPANYLLDLRNRKLTDVFGFWRRLRFRWRLRGRRLRFRLRLRNNRIILLFIFLLLENLPYKSILPEKPMKNRIVSK